MYENARQDAEKIIDEVLTREDFAEKPTADLSWLEKILDDISQFRQKIMEKIWELIEKFIKWLYDVFGISGGDSIQPGGASIIRTIAIILIVLVSVAIIVTVTVLVIRVVKKSKEYKNLDGDTFEEELEAYSNDSDTPYQRAKQLEAEGDYRGAFRYLYISLLASMSVAGIIVIHHSKTNRRYLREIKKNYEAAWKIAAEFTERFNLSWYGRRTVDREDISDWFKKYDEVKSLIKNFSSGTAKAEEVEKS